MLINIGSKIKSLRTSRGLSVSELASFLDVTDEELLSWEDDASYPSIELLPLIANYFGTTTDDLLDAGNFSASKKITDYKASFQMYLNDGEFEKCVEVMREALKLFPDNFTFMRMLLSSLYLSCNRPSEVKFYTNEITELSNKILSECTDDKIRLETKKLLCKHYFVDLKDIEKAQEIAESLPTRFNSKEEILPTVTEGDDKLFLLQENIMGYLDSLATSIKTYAIENKDLTTKERIVLYDTVVKLNKLVYVKSDYMWGYVDLMYTYKQLAVWYMSEEEVDKALDCLEAAAICAVQYDNLPEVIPHISPLVNRLAFDKKKVVANGPEGAVDTRSKRAIFIDDFLRLSAFDSIRYTERIKKICDILK